MNSTLSQQASQVNEPRVALCVDMGTTNTRAWLVADNQILARQSAAIGVRDSVRAGNSTIVQNTLKDLVAALQTEAHSSGRKPTIILGAGMITSSLGLLEIDHVPAPAGDQELSRSMQKLSSPVISELPIWLIPGIRTGMVKLDAADVTELDMMRGEETLSVGLHHLGILKPNATLLNLGSHWKAITLDAAGRIASSFTTLSGELIHSVQQHTVLSSAVPQGRFTELDLHWLEQGCAAQRISGLSRALFCVRLLEQKFKITALQRSSFLLGAVVGADLAAVIQNKKLGKSILISGSGASVGAWEHLLKAACCTVSVCEPQEVEAAFVTGLFRLAELASLFDKNSSQT